MAPKKSKASSSRGNQEIAPVPGFESVKFNTEVHKKRFIEQIKREVKQSRFICITTLLSFMLDAIMREIFTNIGMLRIFEMQYVTYPHLVYEFFSSFKQIANVDDHAESRITFRLLNENRSLTKREFAQHFGLPLFNEEREHDTFVGVEMWQRMTGQVDVELRHLSVNRVQHPVFRIFLKFLSNCFLGRPNNHHTRVWDVCILGQAVLPGPDHVDVASILWDHFKTVATSTGTIRVGGLITHLATLYGFVDPGPITSAQLVCTSWLLKNTKDIVFSHKTPGGVDIYNWLIDPPHPIYTQIPSADLPLDLLNHQIGDGHHYCLPGRIPLHYQQEQPQQDQPAHEPPPLIPEQPQPTPNAHQYSPFEQEMLNSMNALNLNYTQLREEVVSYRTEQRQSYERIEEQRQADWRRYEEDRRRDQEDQRRTFGPIYSYVAHQGAFAAMTTPPPAPSWYNPTEWGYFGGSSSSGGGGDDGYGGDRMDEDAHFGGYQGHGGFYDGGDAGGH
ncbi:unnamed protein product [Cuscuta epithymum]|uniref:Arabidopsis retrotransposon Orf1 C-terminal domain-containing protein n=1 Tax=Cuscuta epithymum TaxID=186058 RepID=A0AAV0EL71_9ASTE|nr:unnamed protein product [Cuscuta epithymum]